MHGFIRLVTAKTTTVAVAPLIALLFVGSAMGDSSEALLASSSLHFMDWQPDEQGAPGADSVKQTSQADLAKKLSNPISDLISVPFQFNYDEGYGPKDGGRVNLNIQPVIPFSISEDWNLITRTIVPITYQDSPATGVDSAFGLGDVTLSLFFSPKKPIDGWIIGAGPVALIPTGTDPLIRSENFGLGPTLVALRQENGWTVGALANQIWGVASSDDRQDVSTLFLQPFLAYTFSDSTTLTLNTESTYDWNSEQWVVPINALISHVYKIGGQPVQFQFGGRYYAEAADEGPDWGLRLNITFLFPK